VIVVGKIHGSCNYIFSAKSEKVNIFPLTDYKIWCVKGASIEVGIWSALVSAT
jgi:hypothetical protein